MARRWHILRDAGGLTLARSLPARFDVWSETELPAADPLRLAHQIRQDMWRAMQSLRGFAPVVRITEGDAGLLTIRAGGQVAGAIPANAPDRIDCVLSHPGNRQRWLAHAKRKGA